jgi:hypothetical protein
MGPIGFPETSERITTTTCVTTLKSAVLKVLLSSDLYNKNIIFPYSIHRLVFLIEGHNVPIVTQDGNQESIIFSS